jgi:hypothetical protein
MPWQLIYTSAPRGLLSGQSGFCTVARSADLREALVQRLEQLSSYHYLRVAEAATANRNPAVSAFRLLDLRGAKYYVLTRIQPCGLDFTARTNHLAHHLIFQPDELANLPSPAAILRHWPDWKASWQGEPRLLEGVDSASLAAAARNFLPAQTWARLTGDGGRAAGLLESECVRGCYLVCPPGSEDQVLAMYCETLQLLNFNGQFPLRPWRHTFTAFLQAEDNPNDFQWRGCQENTPAYKQALTRSAPMMALRSVRVPANSLVKLARAEPKPPSAPTPPNPAPSGPAPPSALKTVKREASSRSAFYAPQLTDNVNIKKPARREKPAFLDLNFSINSATLAGLGIFAAVLVVLLLIKFHWANRLAGQGSPAPASILKPPPQAAPPPKRSLTNAPLAVAAPDATQIVSLEGDGPTYALVVRRLSHFNVSLEQNIRFKRLLTNYFNLSTMHTNIELTANTDQWYFPQPEARMEVEAPTGDFKFSAAGNGLTCVLDCNDWWLGRTNSITAQVHVDGAAQAFSLRFSSPDDDPFRLLIVNEKNPPAPLYLTKEFLQNDAQDLLASLSGTFHSLEGWRLQLQPLARSESHPAQSQCLYKDWPLPDKPAHAMELNFAKVRRPLGETRENLNKKLNGLIVPLALPLGRMARSTNTDLESFWAYSPTNLTPSRFLEYLGELKKSSPEEWLRKWHTPFDPEQPDVVSDKLQSLYTIWGEKRPEDKPLLTVTNANGTTNYFFDTWMHLKDVALLQEQLAAVQKRLFELDHAFVGLCMVGPNQPGPGVEMIRFEGP